MAQEIIYGAYHGDTYLEPVEAGETPNMPQVIHDPRMEISWIGRGHDQYLQIGIVHPNKDGDYNSHHYDTPPTDSDGIVRDDFLTEHFKSLVTALGYTPVEDGSDAGQNRLRQAFDAGVKAHRQAQLETGRAVFMQVTRSACNRMVRAVRTGRDKVYGKDE